jgi:hypothetical protein
MKQLLPFLFCWVVVCCAVRGQFVTIPDTNFATYLQTAYPGCMSGNQMDTTCAGIVNADSIYVRSMNIGNLEGIQYFDNLEVLYGDNNNLTGLPSLPMGLRELYVPWNDLVSLPILPPNLVWLYAIGNQITTLPALP